MRRISNNIRNHRNWLQYYFHKYLGNRSADFTFKHRNGPGISIPPRLMHTYKECFFDQTYTRLIPERVLQTKAKLNVVDIGANVGFFSMFMILHYPNARVCAYEPMPNNFRHLLNYRELVDQKRYRAFNKAVAGKEGLLTLRYDESEEITTAATLFDKTDQPDSLEVECTTLKQLMKENGMEEIDLLKLDCEGAEYDILYSGREMLKHIRCIAIETHEGPKETETRDSMVVYLKRNGFTTRFLKDIIWAWK